MNDECPTCGAKLHRLTLKAHATHAVKAADSRGRRDQELLAHAKRLQWSTRATGTMQGAAPGKKAETKPGKKRRPR